ncbi:uncharacterized protein LOC125563179 isoform X2 [Nematostella vectensis]|uniref:uncharacterized protein LOC125563179 isoform X2 n=1 Tax=Nematostella vectensis TaxID=45351 RepID=UPI0020778D4C|nr:uncharacterized protein LOC125563179 isoform X2 [Nematostella vectensis]
MKVYMACILVTLLLALTLVEARSKRGHRLTKRSGEFLHGITPEKFHSCFFNATECINAFSKSERIACREATLKCLERNSARELLRDILLTDEPQYSNKTPEQAQPWVSGEKMSFRRS